MSFRFPGARDSGSYVFVPDIVVEVGEDTKLDVACLLPSRSTERNSAVKASWKQGVGVETERA